MDSPEPHAPQRTTSYLPLLGVMAIAVLVYANAFANGFAGDDVYIVVENPVVHGFARWRELLFGSYWPATTELYRPAVLLSFAALWSVVGDAAWLYHAVVVTGHAVVTGLLFTLLRRLGATPAQAVLGAVVFAVHPVHVEAVASVVGWAEVLSAIGVLIACLLHLRSPRPSWRTSIAIAICYFLALCAKEIAITLPALLVLLTLRDQPLRPRPVWSAVWPQLRTGVAMIAALGVYMALRVQAVGGLGTGESASLAGTSTLDRLATAARLVLEDLRLLFWPRTLSSDWTPGTLSPVTWQHPLAWVGLAVAAACFVIAFRTRARSPWAWLATLWFAISILPVSHVFFPVGVLIAERTLYLPSVGLALLAPAALALTRRARPALVLSGAAALILLAAARTWTRTPVWKSNTTLVNTFVREHPEAWSAQGHLAEMLMTLGRRDEAIEHLIRADSIIGGHSYTIKHRLYERLMLAGRPAEAAPHIRAATRLVPEDPSARLYLAAADIALERPRAALREADLVERSWRRETWLKVPLARIRSIAYLQAGRADSALTWSDSVVRHPPTHIDPAVWLARASIQLRAGRDSLAEAALDSARVRMTPQSRAGVTRAWIEDPALLRQWFMVGDLYPPSIESVLDPYAGGPARR